ncbi:MAG: hypothetical protein PVH19_09740 [Planctomycetia bacterium]|jgi:hypothetical protein
MKMKFGVGVAVLVVLAILWGTLGGGDNRAMGGPPVTSLPNTGGVIAMSQLAPGNQTQIVTVVDPVNRSIATYQINLTSGAIKLCSVRNIRWDLQMSDYNGVRPLSKEVQTMSEQR